MSEIELGPEAKMTAELLYGEIAELKAANRQLREALEKYADEKNWFPLPGRVKGLNRFFNNGNCVDGWNIARQALNDQQETQQ